MQKPRAVLDICSRLVAVALEWQEKFGVAPAITSAISEIDAALLIGMTEDEYGLDCSKRTAVTRGHDFVCRGCRYQVKANRPSGRKGSPVTLVSRVKNYEWDKLIWILYDREYAMQEAWEWTVKDYKRRIAGLSRVSPADMRRGICLFPFT
jgi:hypothetical protein